MMSNTAQVSALATPVDDGVLTSLVARIADENDLYFDSLLEVGCGRRPLAAWFSRLARSEAPKRYVCIEPDEVALAAARAAGLMGFKTFSAPFDIKSDLVMAVDVLEYLAPQRVVSFLRTCAGATNKLFAISTLNARSWNRNGVKKDYGHLKWVPSAALQCFRPEDDLSRIRHVVDADRVRELLVDALGEEDWSIQLFEGAPWELRDLTSERVDRLHTKTFAVAMRKG